MLFVYSSLKKTEKYRPTGAQSTEFTLQQIRPKIKNFFNKLRTEKTAKLI
jgi:hypothetical protein